MDGRGLLDRWTPRAWLTAAPTTALWPCRMRDVPKPWPTLNCWPIGHNCSKNSCSRLIHSMARSSPPCPLCIITGLLTQSEYATDVIFKKPEALQRHYPAFVHHAMRNFQSLDVMRFLGHRVPTTTGKVNGRFKDQVISDLKHRSEGYALNTGRAATRSKLTTNMLGFYG